MASICTLTHPIFHILCRTSTNPIPHNLLLSPSSLYFSRCAGVRLCNCSALKTTSSESGGIRDNAAELLRKPVISTEEQVQEEEGEDSDDEIGNKKSGGDEQQGWVDWEDQILEDTVPLVGFVRMILHSGKYAVGDKLNPEHQRTILQRLLPYHPEYEQKIGCGVDYITVGYHPDFESSRCLFIVRKDGESVDFSFWKCIKGLIRKNYPLYADSFILRHFRRRRRRRND